MLGLEFDFGLFIGVASQKQHGKDTLSDYLAECLNEGDGALKWERDAFALNVKRIYCDTFDVDMETMEEWKVKDEPPEGFDMNVRKSLQFIGDGFRQIKSSIWIDLMFRNTTKNKIISDVRYPNEFSTIKKRGGLNILMGRTEKLNDDENSSESLIRPYVEWGLKNFSDNFTDLSKMTGEEWCDSPAGSGDFDVFIRNDGSKEDLYETIRTKLVPYVQEWSVKCLT